MTAVAVHPSGAVLASGSEDRTVKLWDVETGVRLAVLAGHGARVSSVTFNADGSTLATASDDGTVRLWTSLGRLRRTLDLGGDPVLDVAFSPNGDLIASALSSGIIALHDVKSGDRVGILTGHTSGVRAVVFSPDGTLLASGAWWLRHEAPDHTSIRLWDIASSAEVVIVLSAFISTIVFAEFGSTTGPVQLTKANPTPGFAVTVTSAPST